MFKSLSDNPVVRLEGIVNLGWESILWGKSVVNGKDGNLQVIRPYPSVVLVVEAVHGDKATSMNVEDHLLELGHVGKGRANAENAILGL